jgi:hypothetical protein
VDIDLQQLQQEDAYVHFVPQLEEHQPTVDFEETSAEDQQTEQEDVVKRMSAPEGSIFSLAPSPPANPDPSEPLPQPRIRDEEPNTFVLAMGLWCEEAGISRAQYKSLRQILRMLEPHPSLSKMPQSLQPLRRRVYGHLPQLGLRRAQIALNPEKMATMAESRKQQAMNLGVDHPLEYLYFFDPHILFTRLLSSEIRRKMHFGFGHFVDNPTEPWHSRAWLASARSTSGRYAHYRNGDVLLPSDMVLYECPSADCLCTPLHLGRVVGVGLDYRNDIPNSEQGSLKIRIQVAQRYDEISEKLHRVHFFLRHEIILTSSYLILPEASVVTPSPNHVQLDYLTGDTRLTNPLPHLPVDRPFLLCKTTLRSGGELLPLCYTHPVRAELEIKAFGRQHFTEYFNSSNANNCLSVPLFTFIDGFGLYRNSYRSLMGIYLLIAAFGFEERNRRANVFPVTLGPHGSNFNEVINCLTGLRELDRGVSLPLPQPTRVCAFTLAFLGDMPQQQANAGFKSQRADLSCRFCVVSAEHRGDLSYDILRSGRYHHSTMQQRSEMDEIRSTTKREEYGRKWGLQTGETALFRLTPALDIILTRPSDPAHSEFGGIVRQLHTLLVDSILSTASVKQYTLFLQKFPFPPGFGRLQSPLHHLKSYSLSEHGRWAVVIPVLLRCWLRDKHIRPAFLSAIQDHAIRTQDPSTPANVIIRAFAAVVQCTSALMTRTMEPETRSRLGDCVKHGRAQFQLLLKFAAGSSKPRGGLRSVTPRRQTSGDHRNTPVPSVKSGTNAQVMAPPPLPAESSLSVKGQELENDQRRPNIHIGLHYENIAEEYGLPSSSNVLIGEDKHR